MKLFTFLIDCLKKGWGNESSPHHFRLPVIWHGLRLPITFGWFYARPTAVSDAALSRRDNKIARLERGASKRRIVLSLAWWLGGATCTIGNAGFAIECDNAKVGTYSWKNWPSAYSDCHYPSGSSIVFPFIMTSNGYVSFTSFSSDGLTPSPSTANSALFMSTYTEFGGYEGTCDTYNYFNTTIEHDLTFADTTTYCHVSKGDCEYIATQATTGSSDTTPFSTVSANYEQVTTGSCTNSPPTVSVTSSITYTENANSDQPVVIDSAAMVSDPDGDSDWDGGKLEIQITNNNEASDEISIIDNASAINSAGTNLRNSLIVIGTLSASEGTVTNGTKLTITFNSSATNALVQDTLRALGYRSTSENPTATSSTREVTVTVTDKRGVSVADTATISITPVNDAPTISDITISGTATVLQTLTATATDYSDPENNLAGTHDYQWHTSTDNACTTRTDIASATSSTYALTNNETGKFVCVTVTPKDSEGASGTPVRATTSATVKMEQTITFTNPGSKTYGDASFSLDATVDSPLSVSYTTSPSSVCTETGGNLTIVSAGDCTVTAKQTGNATYAATDVPQTFTIAKKDITATAVDKTRAYGASNPSPTFTYTDGATGIDTPPTATFDGAASAVGSTQTITCTGGTDDNYNITSCSSGTLTITQASTTTAITSHNPEPSATGNAVTVNFTVTPASGSHLSGDVTVTDGTESCTATLPASSCEISFNSTGSKSLTATYAGDSNFSTSTSSAETHTVASLGVVITESSNSTDVTEGGGNDTYTIDLMTVPTATVEITLTPDAQTDVGAGVGVAKTLNFTTASPQTVTVTADDDVIFEGNHTSTITHAITTSADTDYPTTLSIASVTAHISDNEPGVIITQTSDSTSVTEGGATDSFEVVLSTIPIGGSTTMGEKRWYDFLIQQAVAEEFITEGFISVTINLDTDSQTTLDKTSLVFDENDWNTPQTVTVTAVDDSTVENGHSSTISLSASSDDPNYNDATFVVEGTVATQLSVSITDNDSPPPAPKPAPSTAPTPSTSSSSSSTIITSQTGGPIVEFTGDGSGSVTASKLSSGEFSCHSGSTCPTELAIGWYRFEPTADQGSEFVEWRGQNCEKGEYTTSFGGTCIAVFKKRPEPKPADGTPLAPEQPNVMPGIQLSNSTLNVTEGSLAASYSLWLNTEPSDPVSIHFESDGELIYNQQAITFDRENWQQPQTLKVLDRNDDIADGAHTHTIYHTVTSNDSDYHNILVDNVMVKVTDDDSAGIHLSSREVEIVEGTQDGHYSIVLTTQPTSEVLIKLNQAEHNHQLSESDHTFIQPDSLSFTPINWNRPQDVILSVNDDTVSEGKHTHAAIVHTITSADSAYDSLKVDDVTVHVVDNDVANLMFLNAAIHLIEGGASSDFEIALTVMPTHPVRVTLISGVGIQLSPTTLTFDSNSASQKVKVTAIDDEITEGEHQADIRFQTTSDDPEYHDIRLENLTVNITDNDRAGIKFSQYDVTVGKEAQNAQYSVNLMTEPTAAVTVSLIPSEQTRVSPSQLVFGQNNWQIPQIVIVNAVDEVKGEAAQTNTIVSKLTSDDPNYNTLPTQNVLVHIVEHDGLIPEDAEPSLEPKTPTTQDEFALPTNTVVSSAPVNQCNTSSDKLSGVCHAHAQTIRYQEIGEEDSLSNGILDHPLTNQGMVSNTTITEKGHLKGGFVSGYTQNEGLIENVEFVGASLSGKNAEGEVVGMLGGEIKLASQVGGVVEDVRLAPDTEISGSGKVSSHTNRDLLSGTILGDSEKPAILKRLHIRKKSQVSNVIITENVTYGEGVTFTHVEFRTQFVQKVTLTGRITGTRFQNTYTKLENVTISANSHLSHLVIGDKVRFEEGVTLEDSVTFEVHTAYMETHSITVLPKLNGLAALDKQGNRVSTWARLQGGARMGTDGSRTERYQNKLTLKRNPHKNVEIHGNVLTDVRHLWLRADILVIAAHTLPGATLPSFYMLDNKRRPLPWDGALSSLVAFQSRTALAPVVSVPIWNNPLDIVGEVQIYFGYRLNEGLIVSSQDEVIEIKLTE